MALPWEVFDIQISTRNVYFAQRMRRYKTSFGEIVKDQTTL
jgi:hypothetical protein